MSLSRLYTSPSSPTTGMLWEQPIFTTKAHVFQIDPNTKKKWLPASTQAVNVSYYYDSTRNSYRIISVEGSKAVINSTITPNMTFTKTSQKFGQWMDPRANTVYGLGFTSEGELSKFVEKFKEVKELTRQAQGSSQSNGTEANHAPATPPMSNSPVNVPKPPSSVSSQNDLNERRNSGSSIQGSESQLKYENDRLKIALAQSSANAKKWEIELQTLKNNNARLTTALQESTSNVEEWKKQLAMYKEESARMKKRVVELEKGGGASGADQQHIRELTDRVQQLETMNRRKEEELNDLTTRVQELAPMEEKNQILTEKMQKLEEENKQMTSQVGSLEIQLNSTRTSATRERQQLRDLEEQLGRKLTDIQRIHDQVTSTLQQQT